MRLAIDLSLNCGLLHCLSKAFGQKSQLASLEANATLRFSNEKLQNLYILPRHLYATSTIVLIFTEVSNLELRVFIETRIKLSIKFW